MVILAGARVGDPLLRTGINAQPDRLSTILLRSEALGGVIGLGDGDAVGGGTVGGAALGDAIAGWGEGDAARGDETLSGILITSDLTGT